MGAKSLLIGLLVFSLIVVGFYSVQSDVYTQYGISPGTDYGQNLSRIDATVNISNAISAPLASAAISDNTLSTLYYYTSAGIGMIKAIIGVPTIMTGLIGDLLKIIGVGLPPIVATLLSTIIIILIAFEAYYAIHKVPSR